jgi:hypothetical protein
MMMGVLNQGLRIGPFCNLPLSGVMRVVGSLMTAPSRVTRKDSPSGGGPTPEGGSGAGP